MLAGLNAYGTTKIYEKEMSRDHTERLLLKNKSTIKVKNNKNRIIEIKGKTKLKILTWVFGDPSSAAFFCALTTILKDLL